MQVCRLPVYRFAWVWIGYIKYEEKGRSHGKYY